MPDRVSEEDPAVAAPRVTVVIPTYNRAGLVPGAVESALAQDFPAFEVVVVVDGSTDDTAAVLRRRFGGDGRLRVVEQENGGLSSARNAGVAVARGDLVALLDDDDRCLPGRLAAQTRALDAHPEAAMCLGDARFLGDDARGAVLSRRRDYRVPDSLEAMFAGAWTLPSLMMIRTEVLREIPFDETIRVQEDTDFLFRFHEAGHRVVLVPEELVLYAAGPGEGEGRLSKRREEMERVWVAIHGARWRALPRARRARIKRPAAVPRRLATWHLRRGEWRLARPYCLEWWRRRPWRIRPLLRWLRCWIPLGRGAPPAGA